MNTYAEIQAAILKSKLTHQECRSLEQLLRNKGLEAAQDGLNLGDTVSFNAKTRGIKKGVLIKINDKTAKVAVKEFDGRTVTWTVGLTLLRKVEG